MTMSDESPVISASDYERQFFADAFGGTEIVTVEVRLLQETYQDILAVAEQEGWLPEEALRILLTRGLGYTKGKLLLRDGEGTQDVLLNRLLEMESVTAVMRFYAFDFMRDNKILEMQNMALRAQCKELEASISRLRSENEALKARGDPQPASGECAGIEAGSRSAGPSRARSLLSNRFRVRRKGQEPVGEGRPLEVGGSGVDDGPEFTD